MKKVDIYTDGSCLKNPGGPGGWAALMRYPNKQEKRTTGGAPDTTSNRMEMVAIIEAIKALPEGSYEIDIYSDSQISVNGINEWLPGWIKKDFKGRANVDLWKEYLEVSKPHKVTAHWVKGHNGHPENEWCDQTARKSAEEVRYAR